MTELPFQTKPATTLTGADFQRFNALLRDRTGMVFSESRQTELALGVRQAFAASTCPTLDDYYDLLKDPVAGAVELDRLVNSVTISETHFFRNAPHFDALYHHVLPEIIDRRRAIRTLRIWSAGSASGEEPYSIAILLRELLPDIDQWAITILGTDINTAALDRARKAIYGDWAFREERARRLRSRYFTSDGKRFALNPEVRRMVTFQRLNLADDVFPAYDTNTTFMDLILCRNVTIYFDRQVTATVVGRFYNALARGGWLLVGHSEPSLTSYRRFITYNFLDAIFYRREDHDTEAYVAPGVERRVGTAPLNPASLISPPWAPPATPPFHPTSADDLSFDPSPLTPPTVDALEQARDHLAFGRAEDARDLLLGVVAVEPGNVAATTLLGQAYANLGRWQDAETWCRQAIKFDKLALDAYYTLVLVLQHQGQLDDAIDAMRKVVYIDREYILGHFGLANLHFLKGQLAPALKSLDNVRRLLSLYPDDAVVPGSGGIIASRLRDTVIRQQQQWQGQAAQSESPHD